MRMTYDPDLNVAYIRLQSKPDKVQTVQVSETMNVDLNEAGEVYGIELLDARTQLTGDDLRMLLLENQRTGEQVTLALPF